MATALRPPPHSSPSWDPTFQNVDGIQHAFFRFPDAYRDEIVAFADTIANGTAPTVDHNDALAAFKVASACQWSVDGGRPIDLTELD